MAQLSFNNVSKIPAAGGKGSLADGAVHDFTLEVHDREFVVLAGPTGCGHSTLLRLIAGLEPVSSGEIVLGNRAVQQLPPKDRDVAMVFPHYALFPQLTAHANIAFGLKGRHFPKTEADKRVRAAADLAGIGNGLERKPDALTPVEQLRVAIARAIVGQPKVILFDDPLSALDAEVRVAMRAELVKLQERLQTTVIYATSDPLEAMTMGQRIALIEAGELRQFDTPLGIYRKPANLFAATFLGRPPMNLLPGRLRATQEGLLFKETGGTVEVALQAPELKTPVGQEVVLGIRPEEMRLVATADLKTRGVRTQGIVDHVVATGAEVFYHVQTGANLVVIRSASGDEPISAGRRMQFDIDPNKVHFFDAETKARIV